MKRVTFGSLALQDRFFALFKDEGPEVEMLKVSQGSAKKVEDSKFHPLYAFSENEWVRVDPEAQKLVPLSQVIQEAGLGHIQIRPAEERFIDPPWFWATRPDLSVPGMITLDPDVDDQPRTFFLAQQVAVKGGKFKACDKRGELYEFFVQTLQPYEPK